MKTAKKVSAPAASEPPKNRPPRNEDLRYMGIFLMICALILGVFSVVGYLFHG